MMSCSFIESKAEQPEEVRAVGTRRLRRPTETMLISRRGSILQNVFLNHTAFNAHAHCVRLRVQS